LRRPFDGVPVPLGEPCWEGIAAARQRLRVAWARSSIDYTTWRVVFQALFGPSELWVGDIEYEQGAPRLVRRRRLLERSDVAHLSVLEAQDFRPPAEDELLFTAFNHRGTEVMGVHLETGEIRAYSRSPWFDEADGVFPDGRSTLVTRELARVLIPRDLDLWRLTLDGTARWRRLTRFSHYKGYGVSNSAVSPDGRHVVFQLRRSDAPPGNGLGLMLLDLEAMPSGLAEVTGAESPSSQ
jgi:Tol biopolymer transport system component